MSQYDKHLGTLLDVKPTRLSIAYFVIFLFRVVTFRMFFALSRPKQVRIFERYFYDNIAHRTTHSRWQAVLESVMLAVTPKPTVLIFLTASCDEIVIRRPRISRESVVKLLARYRTLEHRVGATITIDTLRDVTLLDHELRGHLRQYLCDTV